MRTQSSDLRQVGQASWPGAPESGRRQVEPTRVRALWRACAQAAASVRRRLPSPCPLCRSGAQGGMLCEPCGADLTAGGRFRCQRCALRLPYAGAHCADCSGVHTAYDYAVAAFDYEPPFDGLLLQFKFHLRYGQAGALGELMARALMADPRTIPHDAVLIPVPATHAALLRRGFNPASELARVAGRRLRLPLQIGALAVAQDGPQQKRLSRRERMVAGETRFRLRQAPLTPTVIVVDDVMTTGATLQAAAALLKAAGAQRVIGLAAARAP